MNNRVGFATVSLILGFGLSMNAMGGFVLPDQTACGSAASSAYSQGFAEGAASCQGRIDGAYGQGFADGSAQGIARCQGDPAACQISLGMLLSEGGYGESEPNDHMIAANALAGGAKFYGQSYGPADQDWYYLVTSRPNQILTIHFSVPWRDAATGDVSDWVVELRDAAGNRYASFQTDFIAGNPNGDDEINYPVTLGLVGTYYIVVKPASRTVSGYPYALGVVLKDSDLTELPLVVNFFDAEVEPNDRYTRANPIATGVTMYGLINLTFDTPVRRGDSFVWGQGENDWFVYQTAGEEIVTLAFCDKEACGPGNWYIEMYDAAGAAAVDAGRDATPLVAFNTDTGSESPQVIRAGLKAPGKYYMRVNHKRKFEAPCTGFSLDIDNNGIPDGGACACDSDSSCPINTVVPEGWTLCPDGTPLEEGARQCEATCRCVAFGGVVEVPEGEVTSPYNFTLFGTKLAPFTVDSPAYDAYLERPAWWNQ